MKKIILSIALLFGGFQISSAQVLKSTKDGVKVSFFSATPLENIAAENSAVQSLIKGDSIIFIVTNKGFVFKSPLMQEHFNENYMESDKYPKTNFRGKINEKIDLTKDGVYNVTCTGIMDMHGVKKDVLFNGIFTVKGDVVNLVSSCKAKLVDYNINRPKVVMEKIAEEIDIKINANYAPYKKP